MNQVSQLESGLPDSLEKVGLLKIRLYENRNVLDQFAKTTEPSSSNTYLDILVDDEGPFRVNFFGHVGWELNNQLVTYRQRTDDRKKIDSPGLPEVLTATQITRRQEIIPENQEFPRYVATSVTIDYR